jgi:hypothetical protein
VSYGVELGDLPATVDDPTPTTEHEIALAGLAPGTSYYYAIGTTSERLEGDDAAHTFVTAPAPGAARRVRLWVIGDSGTGSAGAAAVRDAYAAYAGGGATDLWLMLGDNAYNSGTDTEYQTAVFEMYPDLLRRSVLWPTRGNHDLVYAGEANDYYDIFSLPPAAQSGGVPSGTEAYYSFDYANVHFVCLDSEGSDRSPGGPMLTWLAADLAATDLDWVIAFWHHPPYTKGSHDSDNDLDSGGRMRDMRANALPILEAGGVDLVLTGHSHSYERSCLLDGHYGPSATLAPAMKLDPGDGRDGGTGAYHKPSPQQAPHQGAVYAVAGSSGQISGGALDHPAMVVSLNELGSLVLDVDGLRLEARFLDDAGAVRDSFTMIKGGAASVAQPASPTNSVAVEPAWPNPFAGAAQIAYTLAAPGVVRLDIVDAAGRRVRTLVHEPRAAGRHRTTWDGRDDRGRVVAPAVYYVIVESGRDVWARKIVLAR